MCIRDRLLKATAHDNKALRVVTGSASSGGSNTFAAAFNNNQTVSGTTSSTSVSITGSTAGHSITQAELPMLLLQHLKNVKQKILVL